MRALPTGCSAPPIASCLRLLRNPRFCTPSPSTSVIARGWFRQGKLLHRPVAMEGPTKKRKAGPEASPSSKKQKTKIVLPEYHTAQSRRDVHGEIIWPAPHAQISRAREVIKQCAKDQKSTIILPDKDADGLSSGAILHHTLISLGLDPTLLSTYFPSKGANIHDDETLDAIASRSPAYIFVLDQGSRKSPALLRTPHKCLIIDHHFAQEGGFPEGAEYVTAHDCPPVATSALLTYHICQPLYSPTSTSQLSWLAALGTHGDLGTTLKWQPPFPDMSETFKEHPKKAINDAVALVNAPRRSAKYNVQDAWDAVLSARRPSTIAENQRLKEASMEVRRETERCTHTQPKFSADASIAVLSISSEAQVHPVIATRWSGHLKSDKLEIVMCANEGYLPDKVNFSCRVAKAARARIGDEKVDIIQTLEGIVAEHPELRERLGESFARGHKEASGGIVGREEWEELKKIMGVGVNVRKKKDDAKDKQKSPQKNTLTNYFGKKVERTSTAEKFG